MGRSILGVCLVIACTASTLRAQSPLPADPAENSARIQAGPLSLNPRFELANAGVDSNVFNDSQHPRRDFTATFRPSLDAVFRLGDFRGVYRVAVDAVYFQRFKDEQSLNRSAELRTELRLNRFVPYVTASGLATRERSSNEVDLRARRTANTYGGGAAFLLFSRTAAVASYQHQRITYDPNQTFAGQDLATQFNSVRERYEAGARVALTPLTTMSLTGGREQMRFALSPERNSHSTRASLAFEFDSLAVITGTASIGYRDFVPDSAALPRYRGLVSEATIRYAFQDRLAVIVRFVRDVDYSVEVVQPYFLLNAGTVTLTERIGGPFDVQGVLGREARSYRGRTGLPAAPVVDIDTTDTAGGGLGYHLGETARISINIEFTRRDALNTGRSYDRRRIYGSVSYGF